MRTYDHNFYAESMVPLSSTEKIFSQGIFSFYREKMTAAEQIMPTFRIDQEGKNRKNGAWVPAILYSDDKFKLKAASQIKKEIVHHPVYLRKCRNFLRNNP